MASSPARSVCLAVLWLSAPLRAAESRGAGVPALDFNRLLDGRSRRSRNCIAPPGVGQLEPTACWRPSGGKRDCRSRKA
ncbi:MAG: hypothetical protein U1F77_06170 [Kiritimatiellia bacterium]